MRKEQRAQNKIQRAAEAEAQRFKKQAAKEAREVDRQLKEEAKRLRISRKTRSKRREVVEDEDLSEILDANESTPLPRAPRPQRQRQAPAYLGDYIL
ncbi:uncharacterized protein K441DRAFT_543554 [Cenococcum geophilum 1.58]|uniref:uncharacterized protein n=1 Tax=Cenococcum geophilum 1.58 TaxID=794803 RepID=UPI00358FE5A6|nr:hypothetical protein K441DRAFT_543554 [Cenococcum geophilum 1.58]